MRFTAQLYRQHIGFMFKKHWAVQGKRVPRDTGAQSEVEKLGLTVVDAKDFVNGKCSKNEESDTTTSIVEEDKSHPNWHSEKCRIYSDSNVLIEGVPQAQVLTKTLEINGLPKQLEEKLEKIQLSTQSERNIRNAILASHVFDSEQAKTAIIKIPERPAFVTPRNYGITDSRKNRLIVSKLITECERIAGRQLTSQRKILNDAKFFIAFKKDNDTILMDLQADTLITSKRPLEPIKGKYDGDLPDLQPLKPTVSIPETNIYQIRNVFPVAQNLVYAHPHTIFLHYSPLDVYNLHGSPVTPTQFQARTLLKTFAAAVSRARQLYGDNATSLERPVVVQSVQTDGKSFHFGVFQLNTLQFDGSDGQKNYWFHIPPMDLFDECQYVSGRPVLDGYNKDVVRYLSLLYNNS